MPRGGVPGDVGERLADHCDDFTDVFGCDAGVKRTVEAHGRVETECSGRLNTHLEQLGPQRHLAAGGWAVHAEDDGADLADRGIEIVDHAHEPRP